MKKTHLIFSIFNLLAALVAAQTDTIPPAVRCKFYQNLNFSPNPSCQLSIYPGDLIESVSDNSGEPVTIGARKLCSGADFSSLFTPIAYSVSELGAQLMEIEATDRTGNVLRQQCYFFITNPGSCDPVVVADVWTPKGRGIHNFSLESEVYDCNNPAPYKAQMMFYTKTPTTNGQHHASGTLIGRVGLSGQVRAVKNQNPLNGVTTVDLAIINRYILGLDTLSPYQIIAADANQDGKVSSFDVVTLRKLLLGVIDTLPNNKSWRFIPLGYVFPNKINPFPFPESIPVLPQTDPPVNRFAFIGVKIGDVNDSADPGN